MEWKSIDSKIRHFVNGHRHIHTLAVMLSFWNSRKNHTASRAGTGTPTPQAATLAVEARCKGAADSGFGQKHRDTPLLTGQLCVRSYTTITIAIQRKSEAKCTPELSKVMTRAVAVVIRTWAIAFQRKSAAKCGPELSKVMTRGVAVVIRTLGMLVRSLAHLFQSSLCALLQSF